MEIFILDDKFNSLYNLDVFESLIWVERYNGYGNFEFYTPVNESILEVVDMIQEKMEQKLDCYVWSKDSKTVMVIEDLEITTDAENGNHFTMSGRGLESILERRIIWTQTSLDGNLQEGINKLIEEALINPVIGDRKIPKFLFKYSDNETIKGLKLRAQYTGDNLYEAIVTICNTNELGFDVYLDENLNFVFLLTIGEDRSYDQNKNPYVIFSTKYENIINSDYLESIKTLKNITLVAGEDEGSSRKTRVVGSGSGLERRELYTDARDIQSETYSQKIEEDKQTLSEYERQIDEDQQSLSEAREAANEETTEYNESMAEYKALERDYEIRIASMNQRVSYYQKKVSDYEASLSSDQKGNFALREQYKKQIENYDGLIDACSNKIDSYNDKLRNERAITYDKIVQYEEGIESEEKKKSNYNSEKKPFEEGKSEIEKTLPNYNDTLSNYEKMISKYEGIVSNDEKSLEDTKKEAEKTTSDYSKRMSEYEEVFLEYEKRIAEYEEAAEEYRTGIAQEEKDLEDLYNALLEQRGKEKLSENIYTEAFTSEIEATKMFVYGKDFFKGDTVQIVNEFGMETKARVTEVVRSQDTNGNSMYPTFQVIEKRKEG